MGEMKETGIIMSGSHPLDILEGRKTMTRRTWGLEFINKAPNAREFLRMEGNLAVFCQVRFAPWSGEWPPLRSFPVKTEVKEPNLLFFFKCPYGQPGDRLRIKETFTFTDIVYRLTADRVYAILTLNHRKEDSNERYHFAEWSPTEVNTYLAKRGLYGRVGWADLLTNEIQRLWTEGLRGLVSATGGQQRQGLPDYFNVPRESQSNTECPSVDLHGISRASASADLSNTTLRWEAEQQSTNQSSLGNARGELDGSESSRPRDRGREALGGQIDGLRAASTSVGSSERAMQPTSCCESSQYVSGWYLCCNPLNPLVLYKIDINSNDAVNIKWRPSRFMPRWASRILLEITDVRAERLQEITLMDIVDEGVVVPEEIYDLPDHRGKYLAIQQCFIDFWDSLNAKRGHGWDKNDWVWPISFRRISGDSRG